MAAKSDTDGGCLSVLAVMAVIGLVMKYFVAIVMICLVAGAAAMVFTAGRSMLRSAAVLAEQRRRCPVCNGWANSVVLTDIHRPESLCPRHSARYQRISRLEAEVLTEERGY